MEQEVQAGAAPIETQEQFVARRDKEISDWLEYSGHLRDTKAKELELRETVTATLFPEPKKGTNRYHLNGGYSLKLVHGTNYTLGDKDKVLGEGEDAQKVPIRTQVEAMLANLYNHLVEAGKSHEEAKEFCQSIVQWKPELHENTYLGIDATDNVMAVAKSIIEEILTTKPATPQLTFEMPKVKK